MKSLKTILLFFILATLTFQGCSTKEALKPQSNQQKVIIPIEKSTLDNTEFDSEFEEEEKTISDPLSGYNTFMTSFNDIFISYALNPVSEVYGYIIPQPMRIGISNAFHNLNFPIRFVNNILQGKFQNSTDELERFIINSTIGLAGLLDPAQNYMHISKHNEDFGQTLGYYGVGSGFHIVLPFLGPSNVRDLVGLSVDAYASPLVNVRGFESYKLPNNFAQSTAIVAGYLVNKNSLELGQYESLKKDALELYPFLRDIYEQKRTAEIEE